MYINQVSTTRYIQLPPLPPTSHFSLSPHNHTVHLLSPLRSLIFIPRRSLLCLDHGCKPPHFLMILLTTLLILLQLLPSNKPRVLPQFSQSALLLTLILCLQLRQGNAVRIGVVRALVEGVRLFEFRYVGFDREGAVVVES